VKKRCPGNLNRDNNLVPGLGNKTIGSHLLILRIILQTVAFQPSHLHAILFAHGLPHYHLPHPPPGDGGP
jgi:hypothetical protein